MFTSENLLTITTRTTAATDSFVTRYSIIPLCLPGQPVDLYSTSHPDWMLTLNLGHNGGNKAKRDNYQCVMQRHAKKELQSKGQKHVAELVDCKASTPSVELEVGVPVSGGSEDKGTQTDMPSENIDQLESGATVSRSSEDKGTQTDLTSENADQPESVVNYVTVENGRKRTV